MASMQDTILAGSQIVQYFADKAIDQDWSFAEYRPSETTKWTHGYHRYPAKFIPQLVEKLFDEYLPYESASVNDPFVGSGTTLVSAISRGHYASGTDINRIAVLMARAKCMPIRPSYLESKIDEFLDGARKLVLVDGDHPESEPLIPERHIERIRYWFSEDTIIKLGRILRLITDEADESIKTFLLVAFSNVLKNCSIWLKSSTKPTRDFKKIPEDPYVALRRHLMKMQRGNAAFYETVPESVKRDPASYLHLLIGDARAQPVPKESVDLVVTSSPYVTSYEYADLHQLSTIWLDLADDLTAYKKEFIGTSYKSYQEEVLRSEIAQTIVAAMCQKDKKISKEIEAFFNDMEKVINESFRILKEGGRACYVIGDTRLRGVDILNAEVFAETMINVGFKLDRIIKREIPSKILPQTRDTKTGKFAKTVEADNFAYPTEFIVIGRK